MLCWGSMCCSCASRHPQHNLGLPSPLPPTHRLARLRQANKQQAKQLRAEGRLQAAAPAQAIDAARDERGCAVAALLRVHILAQHLLLVLEWVEALRCGGQIGLCEAQRQRQSACTCMHTPMRAMHARTPTSLSSADSRVVCRASCSSSSACCHASTRSSWKSCSLSVHGALPNVLALLSVSPHLAAAASLRAETKAFLRPMVLQLR